MPLQNTGAISASQIQAEFGGTNPVSMSEYYRGGANVPDDVFCHNNTIPANGGISFANFYDTTKGDTYFAYTASTNLFPPVNTVRAQVQAVGGGGGGRGFFYAPPRQAFCTRTGAGGGGGYSFSQINILQRNLEYISIEVGGGAGAGPAGGGSSVARRRNSAGGILENSAAGNGGGGGNAGNCFGTQGGGGGGNAANGAAGTLISQNTSTSNSTGGNSGLPSFGGRGGDASARHPGVTVNGSGGGGRIQIRI